MTLAARSCPMGDYARITVCRDRKTYRRGAQPCAPTTRNLPEWMLQFLAPGAQGRLAGSIMNMTQKLTIGAQSMEELKERLEELQRRITDTMVRL